MNTCYIGFVRLARQLYIGKQPYYEWITAD